MEDQKHGVTRSRQVPTMAQALFQFGGLQLGAVDTMNQIPILNGAFILPTKDDEQTNN